MTTSLDDSRRTKKRRGRRELYLTLTFSVNLLIAVVTLVMMHSTQS
jgi:hypothetical protein